MAIIPFMYQWNISVLRWNCFSFVKTPLSMKEMKNRCNNTMYNSVQEFKNDIEQICANARAYNNPENLGKFGDPFLITVAENFQAAVHQVLDIKAAELSVSPSKLWCC